MEAGVVKHALNNEIIHVKKKLNQAKIQMINKLTRKVKALKSPKKASEQLKEKLQRKAESAIAEVLLLKKVQPKDLIRFAISHQGQLKDYINKPKVDNEKVFAKILLHKALAEKYVSLRESFANMPVDVLLLTRKERLKLKKERAETLKNKKGKKNKLKNIAEDCDDSSNENIGELKENEKSDECSEEHEKLEEESENEIVENEQENEDSEEEESSNKGSDSKLSPFVLKKSIIMKKELPKNELENVEKLLPSTDSTNDEYDENRQDNDEIEIKKNKSLDLLLNPHNVHEKKSSKNQKDITKTELKLLPKNKITKSTGKKLIKKSTKYKNLDLDPEPPVLAKVVDSFFITSSGENYMTLAETRPPDEVKEIHQRGNRQMRRAQMFGNPKPFTRRKDKFHEELGRFGNKDCNTNQSYQKQAGKSSPIKQQDNNFKTSKRFSKMDDSGGKRKLELVPEKLHPSWEAKKQKSGIVAFQGKKVVF